MKLPPSYCSYLYGRLLEFLRLVPRGRRASDVLVLAEDNYLLAELEAGKNSMSTLGEPHDSKLAQGNRDDASRDPRRV